jgi:hypothetical protein
MKTYSKLFSGLVVLISMTGAKAFATCKDGASLAESAALKEAKKKFAVQCVIAEETERNMSWPSQKLEGYRVQLSCAGQPTRSYSVTLEEAEDAQCIAIRAKLLRLRGAQCGLSDSWGGDDSEWNFNEKRELAVDRMSAAKLRKLPKVTQSQLIFTVGEKANNDVVTAVKLLKSWSEAEEVYVKYFEFKGVKYASVLYYGGGNPVGYIFKDGSSKPIAENGDDSISCVE